MGGGSLSYLLELEELNVTVGPQINNLLLRHVCIKSMLKGTGKMFPLNFPSASYGICKDF